MAKMVKAKTAKLAKLTASKKKTVVKAAKAIKKTVAVAAKKTVKAVQAQEKTIKKNTDKIAAKAQELLAKKAATPAVATQVGAAKPKGALFGKPGGRPPGRRGRRPKNVEYTPSNSEEESYVLENDYETLEYDTGINIKGGKDDMMSLDRVEDFDEELNFDW